jgi:hypothetical protein
MFPGFGFIVGVNIADRNAREIVFRNIPVEIGYVVVVSLFVHLFFASRLRRFPSELRLPFVNHRWMLNLVVSVIAWCARPSRSASNSLQSPTN